MRFWCSRIGERAGRPAALTCSDKCEGPLPIRVDSGISLEAVIGGLECVFNPDKPKKYVLAMQHFRLRFAGVFQKLDLRAEFLNSVKNAAIMVRRREDLVFCPSLYFSLSPICLSTLILFRCISLKHLRRRRECTIGKWCSPANSKSTPATFQVGRRSMRVGNRSGLMRRMALETECATSVQLGSTARNWKLL